MSTPQTHTEFQVLERSNDYRWIEQRGWWDPNTWTREQALEQLKIWRAWYPLKKIVLIEKTVVYKEVEV